MFCRGYILNNNNYIDNNNDNGLVGRTNTSIHLEACRCFVFSMNARCFWFFLLFCTELHVPPFLFSLLGLIFFLTDYTALTASVSSLQAFASPVPVTPLLTEENKLFLLTSTSLKITLISASEMFFLFSLSFFPCAVSTGRPDAPLHTNLRLLKRDFWPVIYANSLQPVSLWYIAVHERRRTPTDFTEHSWIQSGFLSLS